MPAVALMKDRLVKMESPTLCFYPLTFCFTILPFNSFRWLGARTDTSEEALSIYDLLRLEAILIELLLLSMIYGE